MSNRAEHTPALLRDRAIEAAKPMVSRFFEKRGNHSEMHLSEESLANIVASAYEIGALRESISLDAQPHPRRIRTDMNDMTNQPESGERTIDESALARVLEKALQGSQENVWPRQNAPQHEHLIESAIIQYKALQQKNAELAEALKNLTDTADRLQAALAKAGVV